jgi:hypothetical protein
MKPSPYLKKGKAAQNRRSRARKELHIKKVINGVYMIWGGECRHIVKDIAGQVSCDCQAFIGIDGTKTDYCSHIAKYDLVVKNNEGELS